MEQPLDADQLRMLKRCASSTPVTVTAEGGLQAGATALPPVKAGVLLRRGLVTCRAGRVKASAEGRALLRRSLAAKAAPDQAYANQHRRLVRRRDAHTDSVLTVNAAESPLARLGRRRHSDGRPLLTTRQLEAGERLRSDFEAAGLMPSITRDYSNCVRAARSGPVGLLPSDIRVDAKRRFDRAEAAVGPGLADILVRVCCWLEGLEQAEAGLGWPVRSGKVVLAIALDRLADHYEGKRTDLEKSA